MKPRRIELPTLEPQVRLWCGVLILLSVIAPTAWAWIDGPGIAGPIKMFGLPLLMLGGIVCLLWFSPMLRSFVHQSFLLDGRAWPVAFVVATVFIFVPVILEAAWRVFVVGSNAAPSLQGDWIAATAPISNTSAGRVFIVAYFCTVSVVVEEIVYRLLLLVSMSPVTKWIPYSLLSALLFAISHLPQGLDRMATVFILIGFPAALYFFRSRNLGAITIFHATFNAVALGFIFFK